MGMALRGPCFTSAKRNVDDYAFARDLGLPISVHVGMAGTADAVTTLQRYSLLGADVNYVHANMLTDREFDLIAETQGTVTITPSTGMLMQFGTFPATGPSSPSRQASRPISRSSTCDPRTSTDSATRSPS
jgi:cytosine/adenosine deaminase-related metal-dependent hydrolase